MTGCCAAEGVVDLRLRCIATFAENSLGKLAGRFDVGDVVQQSQRLQRGIRPLRPNFANLPLSHVKQNRRGNRPPPEDIQAAAIEVFTVVLKVIRTWSKIERFPDARRLIRSDSGSTDLFHQQSPHE